MKPEHGAWANKVLHGQQLASVGHLQPAYVISACYLTGAGVGSDHYR